MDASWLKTPISDHYSATVTNLSDRNVLNDIKIHLTESQLEMYTKTCFGKLLDIPLKFQGAFIHCLLLREVILSNPRPLEMWFQFSDHQIRFGPYEFAILSGLRFGSLPAPSSFNFYEEVEVQGSNKKQRVERNRLRDTYFPGMEKISLRQYKDKFTSINFSMVPDEDAVKLALILFLELYIHGRDKRRYITEFHMQLVDDLDRFNVYPWGTYAWAVSYKYLRDALSGRTARHLSRVQKKKSGHEEKYNLGGCPYFLQVCRGLTFSIIKCYIYLI